MDLVYMVRAIFQQLMNQSILKCSEKDIERVFRQRKWIDRFLLRQDGDPHDAAISLIRFCHLRKMTNIESIASEIDLKDHNKLIRICGKTLDNHPLLVFNVSEILKYLMLNGDESFIKHLVISWFEKIDSGNTQAISVLLYHGSDRFMDKAPAICESLLNVDAMYGHIVKAIYVFDDVLSWESRKRFNLLNLIVLPNIRIISSGEVKKYLRFDVNLYERENSGDKTVKERKKSPKKVAETKKKGNVGEEEERTVEGKVEEQTVESSGKTNGEKIIDEKLEEIRKMLAEVQLAVSAIMEERKAKS